MLVTLVGPGSEYFCLICSFFFFFFYGDKKPGLLLSVGLALAVKLLMLEKNNSSIKRQNFFLNFEHQEISAILSCLTDTVNC